MDKKLVPLLAISLMFLLALKADTAYAATWNTSFTYCRNLEINPDIYAHTGMNVDSRIDASAWANHPYNNTIRIIDQPCNNTGSEVNSSVYDIAQSGGLMSAFNLSFWVNDTVTSKMNYSIYYDTVSKSGGVYDSGLSISGSSMGWNITIDNIRRYELSGGLPRYWNQYIKNVTSLSGSANQLKDGTQASTPSTWNKYMGFDFTSNNYYASCAQAYTGSELILLACNTTNTTNYIKIYSHNTMMKIYDFTGIKALANYYVQGFQGTTSRIKYRSTSANDYANVTGSNQFCNECALGVAVMMNSGDAYGYTVIWNDTSAGTNSRDFHAYARSGTANDPILTLWSNNIDTGEGANVTTMENITLGVYASDDASLTSLYFAVNTPYNILLGNETSAATVLNITIAQPSGTIYASNASIRYYVTGTSDKCQYELDGSANVSLDGCVNSSLITSDGSHTIKIWANDTSGTWYSASSSFNILTAITIRIDSPLGIQSATNVSLAYVITGVPDTCKYEKDGSANITLTGCGNTTILLSEASHTIKFWANSTASIVTSNSTTFIVDASAPVVTIAEPSGNYLQQNVSIRYRWTDIDGINLCFYELDGLPNVTLNGCANTSILLSSGTHSIKIFAVNNAFHAGEALSSFIVDIQFPVVSIYSPTGNYVTNVTYNASISYAILGDQLPFSCQYERDGLPNVTLSGCKNSSLLAGLGLHSLNIYATDNLGVTRSASTSFTVSSTPVSTPVWLMLVMLGLLTMGIAFFALTKVVGHGGKDFATGIVIIIAGIVLIIVIASLIG